VTPQCVKSTEDLFFVMPVIAHYYWHNNASSWQFRYRRIVPVDR